MKKILILLFVFTLTYHVYAQEKIVFTGIPIIKISEGGTSRTPETLSKNKAIDYKCTITKIDDKYYWTTRENVELMPIQSGAFITFLATTGTGYVRILNPETPELRALAQKMGSLMGDPEGKFDYIEHMLLGLKTITYYGKSK